MKLFTNYANSSFNYSVLFVKASYIFYNKTVLNSCTTTICAKCMQLACHATRGEINGYHQVILNMYLHNVSTFDSWPIVNVIYLSIYAIKSKYPNKYTPYLRHFARVTLQKKITYSKWNDNGNYNLQVSVQKYTSAVHLWYEY